MRKLSQEEKVNYMTTEKVPKLICSLAVPTIISMLVTTFYNMVDTFFVGQINNQATAAVGVVFSVMTLIQALGFFFGHGSGNYISRKMGERDYESAEKMASFSFFMSFFTGILVSVICFIFMKPLAIWLGSTDTILPYTMDYMGIILIGAPFIMSSFVLNNQLRYQGSANYAMVAIVIGAIINIGEESTNISVFNRGIQIKNGLLPVGSKNVDKDLTYVFNCKISDSREMKENFAVALSSYADRNDVWEVKIDKDTTKEVNQLGVSKVVEARVRELLKLAKNEIKNLTNREIRYIIITGGLSELAGFSYLIDEEFGSFAKVCNISAMGVRHNKYSSALGVVKYFDDKLSLRGKQYRMISQEDVDTMLSIDSSITPTGNISVIVVS